MRSLLRLLVCMLSLHAPAWAATYYVSPTGSNSNDGLTSGTPKLTFAAVNALASCGDTIVLLDGAYTTANSGQLSINGRVCTASTVLTYQAANQRAAHLQGPGMSSSVSILNSAYLMFDGLYASSVLNASHTGAFAIVAATDSNHLVFRNMLLYQTPRDSDLSNVHLMNMARVTFSLLEDIEFYRFHRHGVVFDNGTDNVVRRVYCHARSFSADSCVVFYPGSRNIAENIVAENMGGGTVNIQALGVSTDNKFFNIIGYSGGAIALKARETGNRPTNTVLENIVSISSNLGMYAYGTQNTQLKHASFFSGSANSGFSASVQSFPGYPTSGFSAFVESSLAQNWSGTGFSFALQDEGYTLTNSTSYNNSLSYVPSLPNASHYTNALTSNPGFGTCYLWPPDGSALKGQGIGGSDIGATILYQYVDGVKTTTPLWNVSTGAWPYKAQVAGINDTAGSSAFDVHSRLRVNTGGCSFPSDYGRARIRLHSSSPVR